MSRRDLEFRHRTSVFEGAYRAWSHLGGLDPEQLETLSAKELDPIDFPLVRDERIKKKKNTNSNDPNIRREYPYEPLPRTGMSHPFVKSIFAPWLGANADNDAIDVGLGTLRTWWQHRRKGENKTAAKHMMNSPQMVDMVNTYTRHFFELAHCLVNSDHAQPPKTLQAKMRIQEKMRRGKGGRNGHGELTASAVDAIRSNLTDPSLSPLEKIHAAQRQQQQMEGGGGNNTDLDTSPIINVQGKCLPGEINLPGMIKAVKGQLAAQRIHEGHRQQTQGPEEFGDPNTTPVVFVDREGIAQILVQVDGITCAHCVKIVETVLKGCRGDRSPISGLLDAAADKDLSSVMIKIDSPHNAKRIAFEASRNLSLVGYKAIPCEMDLTTDTGLDREALGNAFVQFSKASPAVYFNWAAPCGCPDSGVFRRDCPRHSQMNDHMYGEFSMQEKRIREFVTAGCPQEEEQQPAEEEDGEEEEMVDASEPLAYRGIVPPEMRTQENCSEHPSVKKEEEDLMDPIPLTDQIMSQRHAYRDSVLRSSILRMSITEEGNFGGAEGRRESALGMGWEAALDWVTGEDEQQDNQGPPPPLPDQGQAGLDSFSAFPV